MSMQNLNQDYFPPEFPRAMGRPAARALLANNISTINQVSKLTEAELLAMHGVGPKAVRILKEELAKQNLELES